MRSISSILLAVTAFCLGALSIQCGAGGPSARASSPPALAPSSTPAASSATSSPPTATAAARIAAAKKVTKLARDAFRRGTVGGEGAYAAASKQELLATRDSGVLGPQLVAAAEEYATAAEEVLERAKLKYPSAIDDQQLAQCEYAAAEAQFWLERAKR